MDTRRKAELKFLKAINDASPPVCVTVKLDTEDHAVLRRLHSASLISGNWGSSVEGLSLIDCALTGAGRETLRSLEKEEAASTSIGLLKESRFAIYRWIGAIFGGMIIGWVMRSFFK